MAERFTIVQVTPYPWSRRRSVNTYVANLSAELVDRGHRVAILAPDDSRRAVRDSRALIRRAGSDPDVLFQGSRPKVLAVGQSIPFPPTRRGGVGALPLDVARTIERVLDCVGGDFVHVHEPFAPSASSIALRHSRMLNVGTFHQQSERVLSTQVARRIVELVFGRLDARTANYQATADMVGRFFPGEYEVVRPGAGRAQQPADRSALAHDADRPLEILFAATEERQALRFFLRALKYVDATRAWHATIWAPRRPEGALRIPLKLRDRISLRTERDGPLLDFMSGADVFCACSDGVAPSPQLILEAIAAGAVPVASRLAVYAEALDDGALGLMYEAANGEMLAAQVDRLIASPGLLGGLRDGLRRDDDRLSWSRVADEFEEIYARVAAHRHPAEGDMRIRRHIQRRGFIQCDLHMHTNHSYDCATPVEVLIERAKEVGLGAIAVTEHNEISGALAARELAGGDLKVIVGEEVKTAHQGEIIGLFLEEKIPRGMTLEETIAAIKSQDGLVYVPHPFDRMHSVLDYENLLKVVDDVDIIEVFNPRIAVSAFNDEAERFAAKYRIVAGAGSDAHVPQGLGSVKIRLRDFDGRDEFLEALREADIIRRPASLFYVQTLKFLQTKARPAAMRGRDALLGETRR